MSVHRASAASIAWVSARLRASRPRTARPAASGVAAHRARGGVRAAVELDEDLVRRPHQVGLDDGVVELEEAVDDGLGQAAAAQGGEEAALEEAAGRARRWSVGGEEGAE